MAKYSFGSGMPTWNGVPMVENDFAGWFGTNTWYVDGDNGGDEQAGTMDKPFATIQHAIDSAGSQDTIYIRTLAPDADASEPGTYVEDLTIAYAKHGLKLIGVSSNFGVWGGPKIKNATATALLTVNASNVHVRNLQFNCTRNSGTYGVYLAGVSGYATLAGSVGFVMQNCMLKNSSTTYGGVNIIGGYGSVIRDCVFYAAENAVWMSSGTLGSNQHRIINCDFVDNNGTALTTHITTHSGSHRGWVIRDCTFGGASPFILVGANNTGLISNCHFQDLTATLANSTGGIDIPVATEVAVTDCSGGVGLDVIQSQA